MSFACPTCDNPLPPLDQDAWEIRCPSCGARTIVGLKSMPEPITLRSDPALTPVRSRRSDMLVGASVIGVLLMVLVGLSSYLIVRLRAEQTGGEPAARTPDPTPLSSDQAESSLVRVGEETHAVNATLPILTDPKEPTQPGDQTPLVPPQDSIPALPKNGPDVGAPQQEPKPMPNPVPVVKPAPAAPQPAPKGVVFMGIKAEGKRFCIIADCSGSMKFKGRMERLKKELKQTLKDLDADQQFYVIFFSTFPNPMGKGWRNGGKDAKRAGIWIDNQIADGGTEPLPAFRLAFKLNPRPDVMFFLTDGLIPKDVPAAVDRLNTKGGKTRVPIHTILFGGELAEMRVAGVERVPVRVGNRVTMVTRPRLVPVVEKDEGQLQQVSKDSGGTHRFVPDFAPPR